MYKVHIYCRISADMELNDSNIRSLRYMGYTPNGVSVKEFKSWDDLLYYVTSFNHNYSYWRYRGAFKNHFLDATMCNPNDACRHNHSFENNPCSWEFSDFYVGYLVKDGKGRTLDLRNYTDDVKRFDRNRYKLSTKQYKEYELRWSLRKERWEQYRKIIEGKPYWSYHRQVSTTNERRATFNEDAKGLIRGKRSIRNIPTSYDDLYFHREKSWKARTKVKHQWEVGFPVHQDYLKPDFDSLYDIDMSEK